jgi:hypothetical protein
VAASPYSLAIVCSSGEILNWDLTSLLGVCILVCFVVLLSLVGIFFSLKGTCRVDLTNKSIVTYRCKLPHAITNLCAELFQDGR